MKMNLDKAVEFDKQMFARVGAYAIDLVKRRTDSGHGVKDGRYYKFGDYSEEYADRKRRGMYKLGGGKYKGFEGVSTNRQIQPPNFRLRGYTMNDLKKPLAVTKDYVDIGWRGESAEIVIAHEERKKFIVLDMTDRDINGVLDIVMKEIDKNVKTKVKDIIITV